MLTSQQRAVIDGLVKDEELGVVLLEDEELREGHRPCPPEEIMSLGAGPVYAAVVDRSFPDLVWSAAARAPGGYLSGLVAIGTTTENLGYVKHLFDGGGSFVPGDLARLLRGPLLLHASPDAVREILRDGFAHVAGDTPLSFKLSRR